ncbi:ubiquinone biosynthesis O-methyltransferase [Skeletonema marinoi]|uniref:Ubiquinone biosynthesis O-methyltransferase n=1 Tax=Skeletonema marinoi TaxID=267567 RepID=A0AAD8Y1H8_9STRA|nr:ubiquinone biosynthesis O-methyltransferase [Skeletonema marinoi]
MMAKRLLLRHATRPPSCILHCISRSNLVRNLASVSSNHNNEEANGSSSSNPTKSPTSPSIGNNSSTFNNNSNANPNEVNKFSSFASHWWDSRANPLVGMNPIRIKFLRDVVDSFQPSSAAAADTTAAPNIQLPLHNKRILDIGCGGGLLTESLSRLGASLVVGVDASTHVVEVAKRHSFHENSRLVLPSSLQDDRDIRYIGGITVEELANSWLNEHEKEQTSSSSSSQQQQHQLFDIITALEIIEHVPNPPSLLHAAKSLLKPNGILLVSTINRTVKSYGLAIVAAEYISGKVPIGTHTWDMFWSPAEVEQMICSSSQSSNSGDGRMTQIALSGMVLQPPFINMEWKLDGSDTDVNWIGAYQKEQV